MKKLFFPIILLLITGLIVFGEIRNGNGYNKKAALSGKHNDIEIEGSGKDEYRGLSSDKKVGPNVDMEIESSAISTDDEDGDVVEEGSGYIPPQDTEKNVAISSVPITHERDEEKDIRSTTKTIIDSFTKLTTTTTIKPSIIKDVIIEESTTKKVDTTTEKFPKDIIHEIHPDDEDQGNDDIADSEDDDDDEDSEDDIKIENVVVEDSNVHETSTHPTTTTTSVVAEKPYGKTQSTSRPEVKYTKSPPVIYDDIEQFFASIHILTKPGFLAVIVGGLVIGILIVILFIMFIIYRMRKKDEGSYALDEPSQPPHYSYAYQKAPTKEFYA
uniref:Syndecan n=1 Tax=Strongyloides venezuelensis TaxID=75913 RepID=A0A0K0FNU7_STRVS